MAWGASAARQEGRLQAHAPLKELCERPRAVFIAGFVGNPPKKLFDARLTREEDRYLVGRQGLEIELPWERGSRAAA
ncbi:MAG: hypothetical protein F4047_17165 [Caldilineaceae bacterium SB0670_bin_27]|uniref:Uncharacterized protein n=1 Tax=Caldilineaceae bacterium SB0664_bin_27 TaxID=2605260 RepID=A0A6B0YSI0_9CHLR|nr:hypothetical protein [Caldilineaceae bacterium SB0664_bin_27]MYJ79828.1 hypothetical protein [Caldilineaceae bacterium SB0670_bin_27]